MFFFSMIDYRIYKGRLANIGMAIALILLIVVLIPGVGITRNDATRWLKLGVQFQPSEIMKIMKAAQLSGYEKLTVAGEPLNKKQQKELIEKSQKPTPVEEE